MGREHVAQARRQLLMNSGGIMAFVVPIDDEHFGGLRLEILF
jgi:hypothetical protein